jgi:hypothetical protein
MSSTITSIRSRSVAAFPAAEIESRLRSALDQLAQDIKGMREPWEPDFDSLAVVGIVLVVEDLLPFTLAPEKIVRKGGYSNRDEAVQDMSERLHRQWQQHQ